MELCPRRARGLIRAMPKPITRVGDSFAGTCFNHINPIPVSGNIASTPQDFVFDDGSLVALDGSSCPANCGHVATLIASSALTTVNGIRLALIGDQVVGQGIQANVTSSSSLTYSD
jgi:uncharacterized Zn-binding protein involved in type VI secretion